MKCDKPDARLFTILKVHRRTASRGKRWWAVAVASFFIAMTAPEATPAELAPEQAQPAWVQEYGSRTKDCLEWSDTCVNCVRAQSGENFSCSNIGIACQPKEVRCNRRADEKPK